MFRKLVSYLAFSPSALWGLAKLNSSIRREIKRNTQIIWLAITSLIVVWFSYYLTNSISPTTTQKPAVQNPSKLNLSIEQIGASNQPIEPSQLIKFKLTAKNHTPKTINDILTMDISDLLSVLSFLPNESIVVKDTSLHWDPGILSPGENAEIIVLAQSLNISKLSINQPCSTSVIFGNQLDLYTKCSPISKLINRLAILDEVIVLVIFTTVVIVILISKLWRQIENYSKTIEIKALRNYINRGGPA